MFVLITAPHNYCYSNNDTRTCDERVTRVTRILASVLRKYQIQYAKVESTGKRTIVDLNRPLGKNHTNTQMIQWTMFHNKIQSIIDKYDHILLLDIHSFPRESSSFGEDVQFVILDIQDKNRYELTLFEKYVKLINPSIKFKIIPGGNNYIQNTYQRKNVYPLLIETCESSQVVPDILVKQFLTLVVTFFYPFVR